MVLRETDCSMRLLSLLVLFAIPAAAQISLQAPTSAVAGAPVEITLSGSPTSKDIVTIVEKSTPAGRYRKYKYPAKDGLTITLNAPPRAGEYEIRLLDGENRYALLASRGLSVSAAEVTLQAPEAIQLGQNIEIQWKGPGYPRDFITLVEPGTKESRYGDYRYVKTGNPVVLRAPDVPGEYEIRYLSHEEYLTWASRPIRVDGITVTLEAPRQLPAGGIVSVAFEAPPNDRDFITVVPAGTPERKYGDYQYAKRGSPVELPVPDKAGEYEIRYLSGGKYLTLASLPLTVGATSATVEGPDQAEARTPVKVSWTGPGNARDFITIVEAGAEAGKWGRYTYTKRGSPLTVLAPAEAGDYEIRYLTGNKYLTLASQPIRIGPASVGTGELLVWSERTGATASSAGGGQGGIEIILDASGSMLKQEGGVRRIETAKKTLLNLTRNTLPGGTPFALRVFGHKEAGSCRTDLEIPLAPLDAGGVAAKIGSINAINLAKTPIAASLAASAKDMASAQGPRAVILLTDGEETCEGDPAAEIEKLRAAGVDVRVNIVGFAIGDAKLKEQFRYWARLGDGEYFDAARPEELAGAMEQALAVGFEVLNAAGQPVAEGVAGGESVELPAGTYRVRIKGGDREIPGVKIVAGETAELKL